MNIPRKLVGMFGYDLARISKYQPNIESHLQLLFKSLDIDLVLDVGGNNGAYGLLLREFGYEGEIISFEPVQRCYARLLRHSVNDRHWSAYNFALGPRKAEMTITVPESDDFSSFLDVAPSAKEKWSEVFATVEREVVRVERLDDVVAEMGLAPESRNVFLKLDTQGYDLEVLKGAANVIGDLKGMQSEISMIPIYQGMPNYLESLTRFHELGFKLTGLYPVARDKATLQIIEMDCVMRRD
ncbi:MAG: FkbM family methyltransferase [Desulfurivibrionaceae bacterium]